MLWNRPIIGHHHSLHRLPKLQSWMRVWLHWNGTGFYSIRKRLPFHQFENQEACSA
jgi:hypothetical protein